MIFIHCNMLQRETKTTHKRQNESKISLTAQRIFYHYKDLPSSSTLTSKMFLDEKYFGRKQERRTHRIINFLEIFSLKGCVALKSTKFVIVINERADRYNLDTSSTQSLEGSFAISKTILIRDLKPFSGEIR